jgi:hypothetical protein
MYGLYHLFEILPPWLLGLTSIIQILTLIHSLRSGRGYHWVWIILIVPLGLGAVIYFFVEILPRLRQGRFSRYYHAPHQWNLLDWLMPGRELNRLKEILDLSDTVENRRALAEYYQHHEQYEDAIFLLEGCLRGPFKDDPALHLVLAEAHFLAGQYSQAHQLLEKINRTDPRYEPVRRDFILGRICEVYDQKAEAIQQYEKIVAKFSGEEVRVRLALLLEEAGDAPKAKFILTDVVRRLKGAAAHYRHDQREWHQLAKVTLKRLAENDRVTG